MKFFETVRLTEQEACIAKALLKEIVNRMTFLNDVGLSYLSLNRSSRTLSGGEGQRIRLATQIGSALSGVLYVLDEPSIGLHQRDNDRLIATLKRLAIWVIRWLLLNMTWKRLNMLIISLIWGQQQVFLAGILPLQVHRPNALETKIH